MRNPAIIVAAVLTLTVGMAALVSLTGCGDEKFSNPVEQAIKDRQAKFRKMGAIMKSLDEQTKAGDIDQKKADGEVAELITLGKQIADWFPAGTGPESGFKTSAKPEIWTDAVNFKRLHQEFMVEADKLTAVTGDTGALTTQYYTAGVACANCHKPFRVKKD